MKVAVIGAGHLGTVTAACLTAASIDTILINDGQANFDTSAEPGLSELMPSVKNGRSLTAMIDIVWMCHDTPIKNGIANSDFVISKIKAKLNHLKASTTVLLSAQLPVGTIRALEDDYPSITFACSPENLRYGQAIECFRNPKRIIVGVRDQRGREALEPLVRRFCTNILWMSIESAEMVKHALNVFLATSITLANEIGAICESVGADASDVEAALRSDPRIGPYAYVKAGPSISTSLEREVNNLKQIAAKYQIPAPVINAIRR